MPIIAKTANAPGSGAGTSSIDVAFRCTTRPLNQPRQRSERRREVEITEVDDLARRDFRRASWGED